MEIVVKKIAEYIGGDIVGNEKVIVHSFAKIEEGFEGAISFLSNPKYLPYLYTTKSSVVLVNRSLQIEQEVPATLILVDDAYKSLAKLLQLYDSMLPQKVGVSTMAYIDPTATIGEKVYIAPFVYIGEKVTIGNGVKIYPHVTLDTGVSVGENTTLYSNVSVYKNCKIGDRCVVHSGAVIGADGFGFAPTLQGYEKIPQIGDVIIEDDVEVGANTCIDRATMGSTIIHKGVKLDNLIQIAHNDRIGSHTVIAAQSGVAGSTDVGEWCMFGGQVGIAGHSKIASQVQLGAQSGVPGSINKAGTYIGTPITDPKTYAKSFVIYKKLPEMYNEIEQLKKEIEQLRADIKT